MPGVSWLFFEGNEESGGDSTVVFARRHADRLRADGCIWEYGDRDADARPQIYLGLKGICVVQLHARGPARDTHSMWGPIVPNPMWRLVWALAKTFVWTTSSWVSSTWLRHFTNMRPRRHYRIRGDFRSDLDSKYPDSVRLKRSIMCLFVLCTFGDCGCRCPEVLRCRSIILARCPGNTHRAPAAPYPPT